MGYNSFTAGEDGWWMGKKNCVAIYIFEWWIGFKACMNFFNIYSIIGYVWYVLCTVKLVVVCLTVVASWWTFSSSRKVSSLLVANLSFWVDSVGISISSDSNNWSCCSALWVGGGGGWLASVTSHNGILGDFHRLPKKK